MTKPTDAVASTRNHTHESRSHPTTKGTIEWPTWGILAVCYGGWLTLTYAHTHIPLWIFAPLAAYVVALHSSLQHEALHGHPTRNAALNEAVVYFPVGFFIPYRRFKTSHLRHHCDERLTDPYDDPESWYVCPNRWDRISAPMRLVLRINATLAGRLVIGPALAFAGLIREDARAIYSGDRAVTRAWLHHAAGLTAVLGWLVYVCQMNLLVYLFLAAWPGMSLLLIRSYAEHRASSTLNHRTAIIEASPVFALLFLNNNLHYLHHKRPREPWYRLPAIYRDNAERIREQNGGFSFDGYRGLFRAHLFRKHDSIVHPLRSKETE